MEVTGKVIKIEPDAVRLMGQRGKFDQPGKLGYAPDQGDLSLVFQQTQVARCQRPLLQTEIREGFPNVTQNRTRPRMGVLNIKDRVVPRLLGDLGEVEIERRVVLADKAS